MKTDINELITLGYEVEGLLLLAMHRGDETPIQVWQMIDSHLQNMRQGIAGQLDSSEDICAAVCDTPDIERVDTVAQIEADEPESSYIPDLPENEGLGVDVVYKGNDNVIDEVIQKEECVSDSEEMPVVADNVPDTTTDSEEYAVMDTSDDIEPELTLDEKLARENSRNLRKAFSLNDRFRFRRELFGNSDAAFSDTLDLVEAMRSIDEAREYFFDELEWDTDSEEVKDFMDIIIKHFLAR
ncbi:MAG: hypothetical protein K2M98_00950 [Muribaculum sp.]|nr:hypothetical protein [Muribaculum sp.]